MHLGLLENKYGGEIVLINIVNIVIIVAAFYVLVIIVFYSTAAAAATAAMVIIIVIVVAVAKTGEWPTVKVRGNQNFSVLPVQLDRVKEGRRGDEMWGEVQRNINGKRRWYMMSKKR